MSKLISMFYDHGTQDLCLCHVVGVVGFLFGIFGIFHPNVNSDVSKDVVFYSFLLILGNTGVSKYFKTKGQK